MDGMAKLVELLDLQVEELPIERSRKVGSDPEFPYHSEVSKSGSCATSLA
jgi:hypothetical protein